MSDQSARLLGEIVDRQAQRICEIAGVPQSEDGDDDFQLAWDRLYEMRDDVTRLRARVAELERQVQRVRGFASDQGRPFADGIPDREGEAVRDALLAALDGSGPTP